MKIEFDGSGPTAAPADRPTCKRWNCTAEMDFSDIAPGPKTNTAWLHYRCPKCRQQAKFLANIVGNRYELTSTARKMFYRAYAPNEKPTKGA